MHETYSTTLEVRPGGGGEVAYEYVIALPLPELHLLSVGEQGPPGPSGPPGGGSGVSYMQDHPPTNPLEQETWYNPLTLQLKVYTTAAGWQPVSPDGGHF